MASGDQIDSNSQLLLEAVVATDNGVWADARKLQPSSVHVSGITTATVKVCGSNAVLKPADSTHGIQLGADITADAIASIAYPVRWIKARVSAYTSGTITAIFHGQSR